MKRIIALTALAFSAFIFAACDSMDGPSPLDTRAGNAGNEIEKPNGTIRVDEGTVKIYPDGTVDVSEGSKVTDKETGKQIEGPAIIMPDGTIIRPDSSKPRKDPDGTIVIPGADGKTDTKDDVIVQPDGNKPAGEIKDNNDVEITNPDGADISIPGANPPDSRNEIKVPEGTIIKPDGTIILPNGKDGADSSGNVIPGGSEIDPDGTITYAYTVKFAGVERADETVKVAAGKEETITAPHINGYNVDKQIVAVVGGDGNYTITFTYTRASSGGGGGGGSTTSYTITSKAGTGGSIDPLGAKRVIAESKMTYTIKADKGYRIADVKIDGKSIGAVSSCVFERVTASHTVEATFVKESATEEPDKKPEQQPEQQPDGKTDENPNQQPNHSQTSTVAKPTETGVSDMLEATEHAPYMTGFGNRTFGPNGNVTRAQVAQMFYNLLKDKNVDITVNFSDVDKNAWYAAAVNTLGSMGIVAGTGNKQFSPDRAITRAEFTAIATRFATKAAEVSSGISFDDVKTSDWFYESVSKAAKYGWVSGMGDGTFRPNDAITRAQAATIVNGMLNRFADKSYVAENIKNPYDDVSTAHWAFYQIMEASVAHDHDYDESGTELWNGL